ncbi:MAG: RNB domain-containing ribonuclease, partial [Candidatus Dadabacteria bacterium]
ERDEEIDLEDIPQGAAREYKMMAGLKPSLFTTEVSKHATLGLNAYAQASSPIRRYLDLINQRQILAVLRGKKPPYTVEDLQRIILYTEPLLSQALNASRQSKRFWLLEYLRRRKKSGNDLIEGVVLRNDLRWPLVQLDEVFLKTPVRIETSKVKVGDKIKLKLLSVEPRNDYLKVTTCVKI